MVGIRSDRSVLGAVGLDAGLLSSCRAILAEVADLEPLANPWEPNARVEISAALVALTPPLQGSIDVFGALRRHHPLLPLLVLAEGVDANFASELIKCGAEDFLSLPPAADLLLHKVKRLLGLAIGPAFRTPEFSAFCPREFDVNQRHCYRVAVPEDFQVLSKFPGPVERPLEVKDLSVETDKAPGGLQIAADRGTARRLPFDQWARRDVEVIVQLPLGTPITSRARMVPGLRNAPDGTIRFGVEYWLTRPADKERLRRYWVEAQRRIRRRK